MNIILDDLSGSEIQALLQEHLNDMYATSPPESVHALDLEALKQPHISFWSIWDGSNLAGCIALKELDGGHGEIKSMRTSRDYHRRGVASRLLNHLIEESLKRDYQRLSLETGVEDYFAPARLLYKKHGFIECDPFADYVLDPNSVFMTLALEPF